MTNFHAQSIPKLYNMEPVLTVDQAFCMKTSQFVDDLTSSSMMIDQIENIKDPIVSSTPLGFMREKIDAPIKNRIYGMRGKIDDKEIFIFDSDLDRSFHDEEVIILPTLNMIDSINYNEKDIYQTDVKYNHKITYEVYLNGQIHQKSSNIGIKINAKYDAGSNALYYLDIFRFCYNQQLVMKETFDNEDIELRCHDFLDYSPFVNLSLTSKKYNEARVNLKTPFRVNDGGNRYVVDSIDFINNKILIHKAGKEEKFYLRAESLYDDSVVDTDSTSTGLKVIHVWGSWCKPCIANMPKLIQLQNDHPSVELIGLSVDFKKELSQKSATENNITWKNLYFDMQDKNSLSNLNITSYPTYLVVENNLIIERYYKVEDIDDYLSNRK